MAFLQRFVVLIGTLFMLVLFTIGQQAQAQTNPTATLPPTNTPRGQSPTVAASAANTTTPTPGGKVTRTPTAVPTMAILGTYQTPVFTPFTAIPPAMSTPIPSGDDLLTILLIGSDNSRLEEVSNTDTLILVSIDRTTGTASMMHLARDILVYAPNHTMMKLNTVMFEGNKAGPGQGGKLLKDTIKYNFGITVNFYAHVNFPGFQHIIARLGGLDVPVDCAIQGHRLKDWRLDQTKAENYELYTLPVGYRHLDTYMALWYVRSRGSTNDIDRGRRQMDVLRAIWRQAKAAGLITQVTQLWPELQQIVETDMTLPDVLGLIPYALNIEPASIQRINIDLNTGYTIWYTADKGQYSLLMKPDVWRTAIQNFVLPPAKNRLGGESPTVEIGAAPQYKGYDQTAADRLSWEGFSAKVIGSEGIAARANTTIIDYTGNAKPNSLANLTKLLRVGKGMVISQPDPNRTVDFRVEMGRDYSQCIYTLPPEFQDTPVPGTPAPGK